MILMSLNIKFVLLAIDGTAQRNTSDNYGSSDISTTPIAALSPYQNRYEERNSILKYIYRYKNM